MQKGQTAIEFIFLILIIVIYLFTVTQPMLSSAKSAFEDIEVVTKTNNEAQKLVNSILRINNLGDSSKETLFITLPTNGTITCYEDGNIQFTALINTANINPNINSCTNNICDKNYPTISNIICNIVQITGTKKIVIEKQSNNIYVRQG